MLIKTGAPSLKIISGHALELLFVLTTGFGLFIWSSTQSALDAHQASIRLSDEGLYSLVAYELFALFLIGCVLRWRKWTWSDLTLSFQPHMLITALLLIAVRLALGFGGCWLLTAVSSGEHEETVATLDAGWPSIALVVLVNSVYEEALLMAYLFKRFEGLNPVIPFFISLLIRLSYHTYQGWGQMPMILAMALVFGLYYMKYRKLWPLILAHALGNAFSFMNLHYRWFDL